ncbi:YciI family protein [Mycolicibacterium komossense]|uniref:YciI family protein n=1 Tax=Mycolicibacterium komossense TaxID=1779 RepID=A0ABT3CLZ0_9MYCO|nr:YciI family protein [Mycolicibacterium komossense]MCV7230358.1 YciI family protein [Mycolicibacterium komossense]
MRYMMIMRTTDAAEEASKDIPFDEMLTTMGRYNDELIAAGAMVSGEGLAPPEDGGFVLDFDTDPPTVTDGAYGEKAALFNGFWIIDVASREDAARWATKCPLGPGVKLEVRRIPTIEEFPQDNEYVQKERKWRNEQEK